MIIEVIGRNWGEVYAKALVRAGVRYCQSGREWGYGQVLNNRDGVIIATPPETHYGIAKQVMERGIPVLIEKPVTLDPRQADELVGLGGIAFAGHTRLYSPAWREFKATLPPIKSVSAYMGRFVRNPWWELGPHLAAMCLDVGFNPRLADIRVENVNAPLSFVVNGRHVFHDVVTDPMPLDVLVSEFIEAIRLGEPNNSGLALGAEVVKYLWSEKCLLPTTHH